MSTVLSTVIVVLALSGVQAPAGRAADPTAEVIALERKVMDAWVQGNPDPFLATCDADITYFHIMTEQRVDGLAAVKALIEPYRGRSLFDSYEMLDPKVQASGDTAVLTFVLLRRNGSASSRWNGTEVYRKKADLWRLVHSHWSQTAPPVAR